MNIFTHSIDELPLLLSSSKVKIVANLKKNYKENIHYIIEPYTKPITNFTRGGHNKIVYKLTESAFNLLKNSYNLRNRYLVNISDNIKQINIGMCIENQTIGFIANTFNSIIEVKKQYKIGKYKVDLYFPDYKLIIECDENNHIDRDVISEKIRENYILSLGNTFIRYNPNIESFDLSNVIRDINKIVFLTSLNT